MRTKLCIWKMIIVSDCSWKTLCQKRADLEGINSFKVRVLNG